MPLKRDYSMTCKIIPISSRAPHATKHDHLDPIEPKIGFKAGLLLTVLGVVACIIASQIIAFCGRHASLVLTGFAVCLGVILIDRWLSRVPPEHLSQELYPSSATRW